MQQPLLQGLASQPNTLLLERFLPPLPTENELNWLGLQNPHSVWMLDPFGSSPQLAVQLAQAGVRLVVTAGNPIARFLFDLAAHPPEAKDLLAALGELGAERKDNMRMETHLRELYKTHCEQCNQEIFAEAFIWDKKNKKPVFKIYHCSHCNQNGEFPASQQDVDLAESWSRTEPLHRARALGRVTDPADSEREFAEEALNIYTPRAIYALGTIINRLDALQIDVERRRCLMALLLHAFDTCNSLWPQYGERSRPRSLQTPAFFREFNVWLALQQGLTLWQDNGIQAGGSPLSLWPQEPPESGGICIFEGPLRDLSNELHEIPFNQVLGVIPRPNQAFWTLSALWAGWLWGREAVGPFKTVLRRRRYDWQWQAEALKALFLNLKEELPENIKVTGLICEPEPSFDTAVFLAGASGGWDLVEAQTRMTGLDLFEWKKTKPRKKGKGLPLDFNFVKKLIKNYLVKAGKPQEYPLIHKTVLKQLAQKHMIHWSEEAVATLEGMIKNALALPEFVDFENRTNVEAGLWGLKIWENKTLF